MAEIQELQANAPGGLPRTLGAQGTQGTLQAARQARIEADLAGCEMEELTAALHRKPPVGRWPQLARATFGPTVAVLSG